MRVDRIPLALVPGQRDEVRWRGIVTLRLRRGGSSEEPSSWAMYCEDTFTPRQPSPEAHHVVDSGLDVRLRPVPRVLLTAHTVDEIANKSKQSKVWIGESLEMNHDWFRFLIDGWQPFAPEDKNYQLRQDVWRVLCGRGVPDAA